MEIEKKYLPINIPFSLAPFEKYEIRQGYISTDPVIRIRQRGNDFFLTVKGKGHVSREEFEMSISRTQFEKLAEKLETDFLEKTRYLIPLAGELTAELDIYKAPFEDLITVEVEFTCPEEAEKFSPPEWFGRDISSDSKYKNSSLAAACGLTNLPNNSPHGSIY